MRRLAQSTAYTVMLKVFLASDHVSAATGKTVAIKISKNGGAFADPNAGATNATEVSNGWYKVALDTTDTGTLGDLVVRGTSASCDDSEQICQVVSAATGGATNLDAAVSAVKTKTDSLTFTVAGMVDANVVDWKGSTAPAMTGDAYARIGAAGAGLTELGDTRIANLDATVSSRLAGASYTAPDNTSVTAIKSKTDSLNFTVSGQVDANIQYVNDVLVKGDGAGTPWGP